MQNQFWGQRSFCLVTGASQGIGQSFAVEFAHRFAAGSHIVLLARSQDGLNQTKELIQASNPNVTVQVHSVDLSQADTAVFKTILQSDEIKDKDFDLAMLVHNAGSIGKVDQLASDIDDPQEWNRYMSLNLYHVTALTAEFLRKFTSGHRCIINVTSLCAVKPFRSMGYYCVGKAAREMYFKVLAEENSDLDVLNYSPGPVDTEMVADLIKNVQDSETKFQFTTIRDSKSLVTKEQTTQKLAALLTSHKYKSGDRFDYYDRL
ncbi:LOW QUALITY PROTEIN: sepiapterin reductase-like [Homalodisca vitripennis]|uniref:LOW QUALITY PROTEIN: sepiapterin reductase-like n=1 Tax=Homalodisca vitripennis TaxID=197043 RepID=UPI001EEB053A|nr:LOW QUALITY PROTEIN: sepiapterin reductase-like [Homalodisca vitripennis]